MLAIGTDVFGRVKRVADTSIVTKFAIFQFLPMFPLESYYLSSLGKERFEGIPLIAGAHSREINGWPLASLDWTSVIVAYVRAVAALLVLPGAIWPIVLLMYFLQRVPLDQFAIVTTWACLALAAVGGAGGLASYALVRTPGRERAIRRYAGELLGIGADPARLRLDLVAALAAIIRDSSFVDEDTRSALIRELIATRLEIAERGPLANLESRTDQLLRQLERWELGTA